MPEISRLIFELINLNKESGAYQANSCQQLFFFLLYLLGRQLSSETGIEFRNESTQVFIFLINHRKYFFNFMD